MATPRLLVGMASGLAVALIAFIAAIAISEWWVLPVALGAHIVGFLLVMRFLAPRAADDSEKPDAVTEARVEEEEAVEQGSNGSRREDEPRVFGH